MLTRNGNIFAAFMGQSFGCPGLDEQGAVVDATPTRPQIARIPALRFRPGETTEACAGSVLKGRHSWSE
jgi:hypothetical protein